MNVQKSPRKFWWNQNSHAVRMSILDFYRDYSLDDLPEKTAERIEEMYDAMQDSFITQADFEAFRNVTDSVIRPTDFKLLYPKHTAINLKKKGDNDASQSVSEN